MQTVNDHFVFKVSSRNHKKKNLNNEDEQDDLNDFILDCDYVTYQSKRQRSQGLIDYESDDQQELLKSLQEETKEQQNSASTKVETNQSTPLDLEVDTNVEDP